MLDRAEATAVAQRFGVAPNQIRRDHLISHLLAALVPLADNLIFFGGTALSRTFVPDGRLSEDIDLIAIGNRSRVARLLEEQLVRGVRREFPGLRWARPLRTAGTASAVLAEPDGLSVRVQLLPAHGYPPWPTRSMPLVQRYSDAPPAVLTVPTRASFAAWKTVTWSDRAACRDLYDLWALANLGAIDDETRALYVRYGPSGSAPPRRLFARPPAEQAWQRDVGGQTHLTVTAAAALAVVRDAWRRVDVAD